MNGRLQNLELALGTAEDVEDTAEVAGWSGLLDRVARLETLTVSTQVGLEFQKVDIRYFRKVQYLALPSRSR